MKYLVQPERICINGMCHRLVLIACLNPFVSLCDEAKNLSSQNATNQEHAILVGTWKRVRSTPGAFGYSSESSWEEMCFMTDGRVSIVLQHGDKPIATKLIGTYKFYNLAREGYAPKHEIYITLKSPHAPANFVLQNVRIGEFSCFQCDKYVLWFKDKNGKDCVFEPSEGETVDKIHRFFTSDASITNRSSAGFVRNVKRGPLGVGKSRLRTSQDIYGQHLAIMRIMNEGDSSCVSTLIPFTMPDKDSLLQQDAVKALGAIGSRLAVTRLIEMLKTPVESQKLEEDEDEAILRRTVVGALKQIGDASVLPVLKDVVQAGHEYESVRVLAQSAIEQLSKNGVRNE